MLARIADSARMMTGCPYCYARVQIAHFGVSGIRG